jgi:hypothetical protein
MVIERAFLRVDSTVSSGMILPEEMTNARAK